MTHRAGVAHRHVVGVYDRDADLVPAIVAFLVEAFAAGGTGVVIATPRNRAAIDAALVAGGFEPGELARTGHYQSLDATDTLRAFMRGDCPDPVEFASVLGSLVAEAERAGTPVHLFGEMVSLLWDGGNLTGALDLESLWNDLAREHSFALFCAYALASLETSGDLAAAKQMCDRHSIVIPLHERRLHESSDGSGRSPAVGIDSYDRLFLASPSSVRTVREFVREVLLTWGDQAVEEDAEIIVSELATNAVQHAVSPFRVSVTRALGTLRIAVRDTSFAQPEQLGSDASRSGGRGIQLVSALAGDWGVEVELDGKTVWADLILR